MRHVRIAGVVETITAPLRAVLRTLDPIVSTVIETTPGASWALEAIKSGNDAFKDALTSALGEKAGLGAFLLVNGVLGRAFATSAANTLTPIIGPQLATVAFAVPGLAQGDPFSEAYVTEMNWRLNKLIEIGGAILSSQVAAETAKTASAPETKEIFDKTKARYDELRAQGKTAEEALNEAGISPEELARKLGYRPDAWAATLNGYFREQIYDYNDFDTLTGSRASPHWKLQFLRGLDTRVKRRAAEQVERDKNRERDIARLAANDQGDVTFLSPSTETSESGAPSSRLRQLGLVLTLTAPVWVTFLALQLPRGGR